MSDFSTAKVGDKLWSIQLGDCEVIAVLPWGVRVKGGYYEKRLSYTLLGCLGTDDAFPSLFWSNPNIIEPERPKRRVKTQISFWVNVYPGGELSHQRYSSEERARRCAMPKCVAQVNLTGEYEVEE